MRVKMGDLETLDKTTTTVINSLKNYMNVFYKGRKNGSSRSWPFVVGIKDPNVTKLKTRTQDPEKVRIETWMFPPPNGDFLYRLSVNLE